MKNSMDDHFDLRRRLGEIRPLLNTNFQKASELLDELIEMRPKNMYVWINDFQRHKVLNNYEGAERALKKIRETVGENPYWLDRFDTALRNGQIVANGVTLAVDKEIMPVRNLHALATERFEREEADILLNKIEASDRILECGGGLGYMALLAQKDHPKIPYISFEANPKVHSLSLRNKEINGANFETINGVLGAERGKVEFFINAHFAGSSLIEFEGAVSRISVPQYSVKEIQKKYHPNFLVIDIEGGEKDLIPLIDWKGVKKLLVEMHPKMISQKEYSGLIKTLLNEGFIIDTELSRNHVFYFEK